MSIMRLEDLFVAVVFAVAVGTSAYALVEPDDASPLVASSSVLMEQPETSPMEAMRPAVAPAPVACTCSGSEPETPVFVRTLLN